MHGHHFEHRGEAELSNKFWLVSRNPRSSKTSKLWSEIRLTFLEILHRLSIMLLFDEVRIKQAHVQSYTRKVDLIIMSFHVALFHRPMFSNLNSKQHDKERIIAHTVQYSKHWYVQHDALRTRALLFIFFRPMLKNFLRTQKWTSTSQMLQKRPFLIAYTS